MSSARASSLLVHPDQWARCAHENTALLPDGSVELTWLDPVPVDETCAPRRRRTPGGLAFDSACRGYVSRPTAGRVDVLTSGTPERCGAEHRGVMGHPTGLAVDRRQRLYVAEPGAGVVRVVDLRAERLLRRVVIRRGSPVDVAPDCGRALVLVRSGRDGSLVLIDGRHGPRPGPELVRPYMLPGSSPLRVASARTGSDGGNCVLVLWGAADGRAVIALPDGTTVLQVDGASDLDLDSGGRLVVGTEPGRGISRFWLEGDRAVEAEPLLAPGYDGGAVAIAPNGRIAFTTQRGYGWTGGVAAQRAREGRVLTYRLDSQAYATRWGRVFLEACVPAQTSLGLRFVTTDDDVVLDPVVTTPPDRGARDVLAPGATPTMVPEHLLEAARRTDAYAPFRRPHGTGEPWPPPGSDDSLATYEVAVHAAPGRYLWIELTLRGTEAVSPRVRRLRVERPGHRLLGSLPRVWSREEGNADFLHRFLTGPEGMLHELDQRAAERAALVHPHRVPSEALAWLASFAGLTTDLRWPEEARRTLVAEAFQLFRRRGTVGCLTRMLEIYLGRPPAIIETWRLRGRAGTVLGTLPLAVPPETVAGSASRGTALGGFFIGGTAPDLTAYDTSAHRFTVLVPGCLDAEARAVVGDLLETQRPAHTMFDVCELGDGMHLGLTTRPGLTAYVAPSRRTAEAVVGRSGIGVDSVTGLAVVGTRLGDPRPGEVRVG
jgi:phage tail-like protein